jgi:hypothetical protein
MYITKSDCEPYIYGNINSENLSLYCKTYLYTKNILPCHTLHPPAGDSFIFNSGHWSNKVTNLMNHFLQSNRSLWNKNKVTYPINQQCPIVQDLEYIILQNVKRNRNICTTATQDPILCPRHIYIYGDPGLGKTEVVDSILSSQPELQNVNVVTPEGWGPFMFNSLVPTTDVLLFDDFSYTPATGESHLRTLLAILDSKLTSVQVKHQNSHPLVYHLCGVFISNFNIPDHLFMLNRRCETIYIDHKIQDCKGNCRNKRKYSDINN